MPQDLTAVGGPLDGTEFVGLPFFETEGATANLSVPGETGRTHEYRRQGDQIVFVRTIAIFTFQGGPLDGGNLHKQAVPKAQDGEGVIVPVDGERLAFYRRSGDFLLFERVEEMPDGVILPDSEFSIGD